MSFIHVHVSADVLCRPTVTYIGLHCEA